MNDLQLKTQVCKMLGIGDVQNLSDDENLIERGMNSLKIIRIASMLRKSGIKVPSGEMMEEPTLAAWNKLIEKGGSGKNKTEAVSEGKKVSDIKIGEKFPLTDVQYAYLIGRSDDQALGGIGCHAYLEFDREEKMDVDKLKKAWNKVQAHHPMLRAKFNEDGTQEVMAKAYSDDITVCDLTNMTESDATEELSRIRERLSHRKLDVFSGQVAGITVTLLPKGQSRIHFDIDLLIADVQSLQVVLRDLEKAYSGKKLPKTSRDWNFADYIRQQNEFDQKAYTEAKEYWTSRLKDLPLGPSLPLKKRPDEISETKFKRRIFNVTNKEWKIIREKAAASKTTPAIVFMAAYAKVLERYSTNKKFLINVPLFNRQTEYDGIEDVIADFTTLLLLEVDCTGKESFINLVDSISKQLHKDIRHSRYSGVQLQRDIAAYYGEQLNVAPVVFACNLGNPLVDDDFTEKLGEFTYMISQTPQVWIDFQSYENKNGLMLTWDTVDELFPEGMIDEMFSSFGNLIRELVDRDWNEYIDTASKEYIEFVKKQADVGKLEGEECIHSAFLKRCKETPDAVAIVDAERGIILTYDQLYKKIVAVACSIAKMNISKSPVAITLNRGFEQIVAAYAIIMSGNFYVPVSIEQPVERRKLIHEKTGIKYAITNRDVKQVTWQDDVEILYLSDLERNADVSTIENEKMLPKISPEDSAYIIMTSGTTGLPKGVEIKHSGAWNTIHEINGRYGIGADDTSLAISSMDFDLSVYDVFGILGAGGKLVLIPDEKKRDADYWLKLVKKYNVTVWNSVPILLEMLLISAQDEKLPLRVVMLSGDWIGLDLPQKVSDHTDNCKFVAMGGATEASIWSNFIDVTLPIPLEWKSIPYGRALPGQAYRVVDANGNDCPYWCEGELWIGGHGVAKGYKGDSELTNRKFVTDELGRWYRTGDTGRFWKDGTIEFLGRKDNQVKVRGHRIEIGEIEKALKDVRGVENAVVDAVGEKNGDKYLVAFVEGRPEDGSDIAVTVSEEPEKKDIWEKISFVNIKEDEDITCKLDKFTEMSDVAVTGVITDILGRVPEPCDKWRPLMRRWTCYLDKKEDTESDIEEKQYETELFPKIKVIQKALPDILVGKSNELQIFYDDQQELTPNSFIKMIPGETELLDNLCETLSEIKSEKPLKILEVATRDFVVSKRIREALNGVEAQYYYTDNSKYFVDMAREGVSDRNTEYIVADFEKDVTGTAIDIAKYDIVIAYNSLHRCRDVKRVIRSLKYLMAPSAAVYVQELTEESPVQEITAAVLEHGYNNITDMRKRKNRGLFDGDMLNEIFSDSEFSDRIVFKDIYKRAVVWARYKDTKTIYTSEKIGNSLSEKLPEYMVPKVYKFLNKLPTSRNGKLDRKALRALVDISKVTVKGREAETSSEKKLLDIWKKIFDNENIGIEDNYFALGGDSLVATRLVTEIGNAFEKKISIAKIFEKPTVKELAAELESLGTYESSKDLREVPADPENMNEPFPLTDVQYAYWIGRNGLYDLGGVATHCYFELEAEKLSFDKVQNSFNELIKKHAMMRVVISSDGMQRILSESEVSDYEIKIYDISSFAKNEQDAALEEKRKAMSHQVIDVEKWPLFDVQITKKSDESSVIHVSFDNIIFDGWSMFHILNEWAEAYRGTLAEERIDFSFRDYVLEIERQKQTDKYFEDEKYWIERLEDFSAAPQLPLIKKESEVKEQKFSRRNSRLSKEEWRGLKKYAKKIKVTPSVLLISAYAEVLRLWSSNDDITINLTQFNRKMINPDVGKIVGDFTTLTLLEIRNLKNTAFSERCLGVQKQLAKDMEHSLYSAVEFERELKKKNSNSRASVMPIVFTSGLGVEEWNDGKWLGKLTYNISQTPQVWLDHQVVEMDGELCLFWDYVEELFDKDMINQMFDTYVGLLRNIGTGSIGISENTVINAPISDVRKQANQTLKDIDTDTLDGMFIKRCIKDPDKVAIVTDGMNMAYCELYSEAVMVAEKLKAAGLQKSDIVAVLFEKGWEQIAAVFGILFAGGVYLPLDVSNPDSRLQRILNDSNSRFIVTNTCISKEKQWTEDFKVILIDEKNAPMVPVYLAKSINTPDDRAYVIYTSGTTGTPKGVVISHRGAVNTIKDVVERYGITSDDCAFAISNLHFDLSVFDVFGILGVGGRLVIPNHKKLKEPSYWVKRINEEKITVWNSVPAFMEMLVEYMSFNKKAENIRADHNGLKLVMMSGDWIPVTLPERIRAIYSGVKLVSLGGATEASIWSNDYVIPDDFDKESKSVPYGKPLSNQKFYVLDSNLEDCPDLVPGGLYIAGTGLAECYLNDEEKTNEKFFIHPVKGERLYSTGDMGRYFKDGNIEFLGRMDDQVKINGYRVELGEVEDALRKIQGFRDVIAVLCVDNNCPILGAVMLSDDESPDLADEEIKKELRDFLPAYMIPNVYIKADGFKLTGNGKVDRSYYEEIIKERNQDPEDNTSIEEKEESMTEQKHKLVNIWESVLGTKVRPEDNFFELGGSSLQAIKIVNLMDERADVDIEVGDLFENPTINDIDRLLEERGGRIA